MGKDSKKIRRIRELTVFTSGDSSKLRVWSNVPYFFTNTLIAKGIKVNRVNIAPILPLKIMYNSTIVKIAKLANRDTTYDYFRSYVHYATVGYRIRKALVKYDKSDANIFLTFSFSPLGLSSKPTVLLSDWTYDYYIRHFRGRSPDFFECLGIQREDVHIRNADLVIVLYEDVADYMRNRYKKDNILYLGNAINSVVEPTAEVSGIKEKSKALLFIGSKKYIVGAKQLIEAYSLLKNRYPGLSLHIIGMREIDFGDLPDGVYCYGYLDKAKNNERNLYYSLLNKAKVFINTTPKWGAFSATIEAMYFYNPVITTPYREFVRTFGEEISFGYYCRGGSVDLLCDVIERILSDRSYRRLCISAHNSVRKFTWDSYVERVLNEIEEIVASPLASPLRRWKKSMP